MSVLWCERPFQSSWQLSQIPLPRTDPNTSSAVPDLRAYPRGDAVVFASGNIDRDRGSGAVSDQTSAGSFEKESRRGATFERAERLLCEAAGADVGSGCFSSQSPLSFCCRSHALGFGLDPGCLWAGGSSFVCPQPFFSEKGIQRPVLLPLSDPAL